MARTTPLVEPAGRMVGRRDQLARLTALLDETVEDGSRLVLIGGDAGAGKTTVVDAFLGRLRRELADRQASVIRGQCVALGGDGLPYAPISGALRGLLALHGPDQVLEWAGAGRSGLGVLLPDLVTTPVDNDSIRLQLFEAVARLFERATAHGPLVVVLEDIHWADESTRHLLRFLARAVTDAPVLILATYRTDELTRRHPLRPFLAEVGRLAGVARLEVGSLDRSEVAELLGSLLGHTPSGVVVDLVLRRSEGIPYFVEELAQSAARGCVDMPDTLRDALSVRVQTLSDGAQESLRLAAVAGYRVEHGLLEAVDTRSPAELEAGLREALDASLLVIEDDGYAFRHALVREVVHEDILPGQHARLHARFAEELERRPDLCPVGTAALEIAHHWSAAHDNAQAFRWSVTAAESGTPAHVEALKMYERALDLWDRVSDPEAVAGPHVGLLDKAVGAARDTGESERALDLNKAALAETEDGDVLGRISRLATQGHLLCHLMKPGSVEVLDEAVALIPADASPAFRARIMEKVASVSMITGGDAVPVARQAIAAAVEAGSASLEANARNTLGTRLVAGGDEDEGLAELCRAGDLIEGASTRTLLRFYVNYSDALHHVGRYADAVQAALQGVDVAAELGLERSTGAMLAGNGAEPMLAVGDWGRARTLITRALELDPPTTHLLHLRLLLSWLYVWSGETDAAEAILVEFRGMATGPVVVPQYAGLVLRFDAEHAMATGDVARAWDDTERFLDQAELFHHGLLYPLLAVGAAAAHAADAVDGGDARTSRVREALAAGPSIGVRRFWAPVIEAELDDSADGWRAAWQQLAELAAPAHLLPYAGLRRAQHLVAQRERTEARTVLVAAAAAAEELGAGLLTGRLQALAQRAGVGLGSAQDPSANPLASLTARELEVLRLVAAGHSNGDIGAELFISTKTASVHVSNILAKLGVASRGEAAAVAHRLDLLGPESATGEATARVIALRRA